MLAHLKIRLRKQIPQTPVETVPSNFNTGGRVFPIYCNITWVGGGPKYIIILQFGKKIECKNLIRIPVLDNCKRSPLSNFVLHYTWKTPKRSRFILHQFSSPRPLFKIIFWCIHPTQWHLFCIFLLLPLAPGRNCPETCRCLKKITCGQMI